MLRSVMILKLVTVVLVLSTFVSFSDASLPQLQFHHRLSSHLKQKALRDGKDWPFPRQNSREYHQFLKERDYARHFRKLATAESSLTFLSGNFSVLFLGSLYYATIDVGTPAVPFFVALDTGSDLFWLPCQCKACAPASSPAYLGLPELLRYDPSSSNTSSEVTCGSTDCSTDFSECSSQNIGSSGQCAYTVNYAAVNTSTSGIVFKDVIHLSPNDGPGSALTSPILLGCGDTQTGALLDGSSVPDGLIGLGLRSYSVPTYLANSGLVGDSFSMCFDQDGSGRVVFGDFGSPTQKTTPLVAAPSSSSLSYYIQIDSFTVINSTVAVGKSVLFDTGTAYTFLESSTHRALIDAFENETTGYTRTTSFDPSFELCYATSDPRVNVPLIRLHLRGGATFSVLGELVFFFDQDGTQVGFCVGVLDGGTTSIFGANFMYGYNIVFNREQSTLGFQQENCYEYESQPSSSSPGPILPPGPSPPLTIPDLGPEAPPPTPGGGRPPSPATVPPISQTPGTSPSAASSTTVSLVVTVLLLALTSILVH